MSSVQVTITQLPAAGPITGTESVPIVQNGQTVQTTTAAIAASPSQTQTFLTVNQESTLPNSRYLSTGTGLGLVDGGAQSYQRITLNGASGSLETALNGFIVKTGASTVVSRNIAVSGAGLAITNGDGQAGNPTIALSGLPASLAGMAGSGLVTLLGGATFTPRSISGTSNEIDVANGNAFAGNPTIGLADNPILPGTGAVTLPIGTNAQEPAGSNGQMRFNSDMNAFYGFSAGAWRQFSTAGGVTEVDTGTGLLGGPITSTGTISIDDTVVATLSGSQTLTNKTISGSSNTLSNIGNSSLTNSAITINGSSVSLGGSITVTATASNALTIGTGLSGGSYNGSSAVTIAIDSTVATLSGSQTLTNKTISGNDNSLSSIPNSALSNSSVTFNGSTVALGGSATITASTTNALTIGTGLSGTSFNGGSAVTIAIDSTVATLSGSQTLTNKTINGPDNTLTNIANSSLSNSSVTLGTTNVALGGTSLTLAGLTSVTVTQDPTAALELATKQYVDSVAQGLNVKTAVLWATTGNITLSGLTTQAGGEWTGSLTAGDRILVKNQLTAADNGIYAASALGWTRTTDADTWNELVSAFVFVQDGATLADTGWVCTVNPGGTLGVTAVTWTQFSGAGTYTAGTGLTLTGTQFSLTSPVAVSLGGTGLSSYTIGDMVYASGTTALSKLALGTSGYVMTAGASAPQYVAQSTLSVGSAVDATNAANVAVAASSTNASFYPMFVDSTTTGNKAVAVDADLSYNPSTNTLTTGTVTATVGIFGGTF